jgi:methyl-accepting chemotaxis protein
MSFRTSLSLIFSTNSGSKAARAEAEAGKGFAVVAEQVKELSNATASATADIATTADSIQGDAQSTVQGIRGISVNIDRLSDVSGGILASVQQQKLAVQNTVDAATELSRMAEELQHTVSFFQVQ